MIAAGNSSSEAAIRDSATRITLRNIAVNRVNYVVLAYQNGSASMANFPSDLSAGGELAEKSVGDFSENLRSYSRRGAWAE
jgi:hypothetical protein